ncbi:MAG: TerB family tellurite resistance protein [Pseudomonadota bacterium]
MFSSIRQWLDSLNEESHLFTNRDDAMLHSGVAAVLYHLIAADQTISQRERNAFHQIMREEFDLSDAQIAHLFEAAQSSRGDPLEDVETVSAYLKDSPTMRMAFVAKLMRLINVDGTEQRELDALYGSLREAFPELGAP